MANLKKKNSQSVHAETDDTVLTYTAKFCVRRDMHRNVERGKTERMREREEGKDCVRVEKIEREAMSDVLSYDSAL